MLFNELAIVSHEDSDKSIIGAEKHLREENMALR